MASRSSLWLALAILLFPLLAHADVDGGLGPPPASFDRSSPRATIASYLHSVAEGDYRTAGRAMDLRGVPRDERIERGAIAARMFEEIVDAYGLDLDARAARASVTSSTRVDLGQIPCDGQLASIVLEASNDAAGHRHWVFTRETVAAFDGMQRDLPLSFVTRSIPPSWRAPVFLGLRPWQWVAVAISAVLLVLAYVLGRLGARGLVTVIARRKKIADTTAQSLQQRFGTAVGALLASLAAFGLADLLSANGTAGYWLSRTSVIALILAGGWLGARIIDAVSDAIEERESARDGSSARGVRTRVQVIRRLLHVIGSIVVIATALIQFEAVRELGVSLFASAGLASVVLGFAAQKTLGNLLAGIQISITQPLRIGDDVQIEGDTGTVEEITLSYVVVRLGDRRRLIVPTAKLLETTFRNYTRRTSQLVGEVLIACDFETPIDKFRAEAEKFVRAHPDFDGDTFGVHVVDTSDRAITLRIVASAKNASRNFELRAAIREWAVSFLRTLEGGRFVPHQRVGAPMEFKSGRDAEVAEPEAAE